MQVSVVLAGACCRGFVGVGSVDGVWKYEIGYMLGMVLPLLYFSERLTLLGRQVAGLHLSILVS